MTRPVAVLLAALAAAVLVTACESTQSKSARLAKSGGKSFKEKGLVITQRNESVTVGTTTVLTDPNGSAVAVELKNDSRKVLTNVPIGVDVLDAAGKSVFKNDAAGLEPALTSISVLRAGESVTWVNDQVQPAGTAKTVKAAIGVQKADAATPADLPKTRVTPGRLAADPVSGFEATGYVYNDSKFEQRRLVVYCVARKGGKVVAAGRGVIQKIKAGRRGRYHVFFIGNPRGAKLEVAAPPTVLRP
jgi:hypothetical protein